MCLEINGVNSTWYFSSTQAKRILRVTTTKQIFGLYCISTDVPLNLWIVLLRTRTATIDGTSTAARAPFFQLHICLANSQPPVSSSSICLLVLRTQQWAWRATGETGVANQQKMKQEQNPAACSTPVRSGCRAPAVWK